MASSSSWQDTLVGLAPLSSTDNSISSNYHAFINHRGPDVKNSLASVVYQFLEYRGLRAFLDSQELQVGGFLSGKIEDAIRTCLIQIAIFSPNYAASPWCLAELDLMLKTGAKIVPVFYNVQPSDLRYVDRGIYKDAFVKYVEKGRHLDKLQQWKEALSRASFISGIEFKTDDDMGDLCKSIVDAVLTELKNAKQSFKLEVTEYQVGLDDDVQELEKTITNSKGKMIAIVGEAGLGKTTVAKEYYNRHHSSYDRSSFVSHVKEAHANKTMGELQDKLISDLCLALSTSSFRPGGGADMIKSHIDNWYSEALIILDDIDSYEQVEAFAVEEFLNNGAVVIIITRDMGILPLFGLNHVLFQMIPNDVNLSTELLCWHAFRQSYPRNGYEKMVEDFVRISGGIASNIVTLGQHLYSLLGDRTKA